jgi:uncharacterized protein (TIGR02996 family)
MATEQGFVQALADDPDDDTTRLVFADWLEERGDPRAAWLRAAALRVPDLRRHGGNRALRRLSMLALRDRLRTAVLPGPRRARALRRRAAGVAELYACGLATEADRGRVKTELRAGRPHAANCLARAAVLALRQWRCCNCVLESLVSSARRTPNGPATPPERAWDAGLMRVVVWRHLALAERLAVEIGRHPEWRSPSAKLWKGLEGCDHQQGAAYEPRPFDRRCRRCGHFTSSAAPAG